MPAFCAGEFVLLAQKSGVVRRILLTLWELPNSTRPQIMGIYLCCVSTHEAKLEVAINAGTFLILIYTK